MTVAVAVPFAGDARPTTCAAADGRRGTEASVRAQPVHGSQIYMCEKRMKVYSILKGYVKEI